MKKNHSSPGSSIHKPSFLPPVIESASTSTAAIIGSFPKGSMTSPQQVRTWVEFEKEYGGLKTEALSSHCTKQFFDNEGKAIWVVRIGTGQIKGVSPFLQGLSLLDRIGGFNILFIPQPEQLPDNPCGQSHASSHYPCCQTPCDVCPGHPPTRCPPTNRQDSDNLV